ncbi:MAG: AAA family ATPase, partial [Candidatus Omnitrophota bacterium]|nr:AAA family ATPase [Candidatus Omnitrophota bacterium]
DEGQKLLNLESLIHERLIDQEEAVSAISEAVRRGRIGLAPANRPIASFIFLGPTGVGKTELAKTLAAILFGREDLMIRLDMSEYMEKHEVAKLIGAPPGYVGYEEGGQLTEAVRRKPYSIVLLDEIEKAHPDVFNILLQMLEEGRLTDSFGRKVDFKNTIIIMTSNIGAEMLKKQGSIGFKSQAEEVTYQSMKERLLDEVKKVFKPEFLNRVDDLIVFRSLTKEDLEQVIGLEIKDVESRLKEQNIRIELDKGAVDFLIEKGFDKSFGARPLKRTIQRFLEDPVAEDIIKGNFKKGGKVKITAKVDHLEFEIVQL